MRQISLGKKILFKIAYLLERTLVLPERLRYLGYRNRYDIHKYFKFAGAGILFYGEGDIYCGQGSYVGRYSQVLAYSGCKVVIGKHCEISHFLKIYTMNNEADQDFSVVLPKRKYRTGDVLIGDYVWIGANVYISPGCSVGENSVIGANSVITRDIPSHSIAVGAPARVIKFKSYLRDEEKNTLAAEYYKSLSCQLQQEFKP